MANSDIIWHNGSHLAELLEDVPATIEFDEFGIGSATLNYQCMYNRSVLLTTGLRRHPDFPWLRRKKATIRREEAGLARVSVNFEGIPPEGSEGTTGAEQPDPVYSIRGSLSSEPIETHPDFTVFAGKWNDDSTWVNGAEFYGEEDGDKQGQFKGFSHLLDDDVPNPKAGLKTYLEPSIVLSEVRVFSGAFIESEQINLEQLGNIDSVPNSSYLPQVYSDRNWLLISCDVSQVGEGVRRSLSWRLSGRRKWDADVYKNPETSQGGSSGGVDGASGVQGASGL